MLLLGLRHGRVREAEALMAAPVLSEAQVSKLEEVSWMMRDALRQLGDYFGLNALDRVLVLEHLHYCSTQAAGRAFTAEEKAVWESAKAEMIARAEAVRAENMAEDAVRGVVNTSGGQA